MNLFKLTLFLFLSLPTLLLGQISEEAQEQFDLGNYNKAKELLEIELEKSPSDAYVNYFLGRSALITRDLETAEKSLLFAEKRRYHDATLYLGKLYAMQYNFEAAEKEFDAYQRIRRGKEEALANLEKEREYADRLARMVSRTEDIQIIDSIVVDKNNFLTAFHLSQTEGSIEWAHEFFGEGWNGQESTAYINERKTKVYFSRPASGQKNTLFTMEKLLDNYGNEKMLPPPITNSEDQAYPFVMPDGLTIYFASRGHESIGGYDLFVSRYNLNSGTYLNPNQMNMPFNSPFNDYMLAIDESKGVGWFASDRYQPENKVCVYTFIPNTSVQLIQTEKQDSIANRAKINSIRNSWRNNVDYTNLIQRASTSDDKESADKHDFTFIINDLYTYHQFSDFKSLDARELYRKSIDIERELNEAKKELDIMRAKYMVASDIDKQSLEKDILLMEKIVGELYDQKKMTSIMARNEEVKYLNTY